MEKVSHDVLGNSHDQGTHPTLSYSGYFPTSNQTFRLKRMTKVTKIVVSQIPFRFCLFVCLLISEPQVENIDRICVSQEMKKKTHNRSFWVTFPPFRQEGNTGACLTYEIQIASFQ